MGPNWESKESTGFDYAINEPFCGDFVFLSKSPIFQWNEEEECLMYFGDGNYYDFDSYVWVRPKIKYLVVKCSDGFSSVYLENIGEFTNINSAIKLHKSKTNTQDVWYKIEVEYDD